VSRTITIAAVQMDAHPAPTAGRLARADRLATAAANDGAQLVVLPELFNTGYAYADANHRLAEPLDGPTPTWMKQAAARLNVHLAGSLMLLDQGQVYNALLLFAPDVSNPTFHFPNGDALTFDDMGPIMASMKGTGPLVFGAMIDQQASWLGVPAVNTVGAGHIRTDIPNGLSSFLTFLPLAPWQVRYLSQAGRMQMSCDVVQGCKVVDAHGQVLAELAQEQGETFTVAEVTLADERPRPRGPQPSSPVPFLTYLSSDLLLPWLSIPMYRRGLRRARGNRRAYAQG